jgi:peptidoglycan/xylan/chitin deacetylase (PgdA/CDA1 family)
MIGELAIAGGVVASAAGGLAYATLVPGCKFWGPVIASGTLDSTGVALTYDDGPALQSSPRVLDALASENVYATFFVIGENIRRHPDLLRRMHADGHLIANHTMHHPYYGFLRGQRYWEREIRATDDLIESIIGQRPAIFRPPVGQKTWYITAAVREEGHTMVTWSRRALDGIPTTPQRILKRFADVRGGDVLLLHDGVDPRRPERLRMAAGEATQRLIAMIRARGLKPMRLDELLKIPPYQQPSVAFDRDHAQKHV